MVCSRDQSDGKATGIGRLAPESLLDIFSLVHDPTNLHQIIVLAGVCRRWRNVALSYAPFWPTIQNAGPYLAALALTGSNDMLLDVNYDLVSNMSSDNATRVRRYAGFDVVWRRGKHIARLRTLRVVLNVAFAYQLVLGPLGSSRSPNNLEHVHIKINQGYQYRDHHSKFNTTFFAPQLRSFSCELHESDGPRVTTIFPASAAANWPHLRELRLHNLAIPLQAWVNILLQLSHLETLFLTGFLLGRSRKLRAPRCMYHFLI
jgi:hypothetical protein